MNLEDFNKLPITMSVDEAAEVLGLSRTSAYQAVKAGEIPSLKFGSRIRIPTARLAVLLGVVSEERIIQAFEKEKACLGI